MSEPRDNLARRYRELAREEPPAALDRAILAASRRAVARPSAARRWAAPVSIAAVLVLAFGLTLEMQQDKRSEPVPVGATPPAEPATVPDPAPPPALPQAAESRPALADKMLAEPLRTPAPKPLKREDTSAPLQKEEKPAQFQEAAPQELRSAPAPAAAPAAPPPARPAPPGSALPAAAAEGATANRTESFDRARAKTMSTHEDELEKIVKLRAQGRDEEADKALEEFRRRHPDYRIPDAVWERVKPR